MPKTVLIADDNENVRVILKLTLQFKGYNLIEVEDGAEAIEALKANAVDLLISDISMPNMTGLELLSKLRADPQFAKLPVIICSAEKGVTTDDLIARGANAFLLKPCSPKELLETVKNLIG